MIHNPTFFKAPVHTILYLACGVSIYLIVTMSSCAYNIESELYPDSCDTTQVSYSAQVVPIIENYCYECHSITNAAPPALPLEGYDNIKVYVDGQRLIGAIKHLPNFWPMPGQGRPSLPDCEIAIIEHWVLQGFMDN